MISDDLVRSNNVILLKQLKALLVVAESFYSPHAYDWLYTHISDLQENVPEHNKSDYLSSLDTNPSDAITPWNYE